MATLRTIYETVLAKVEAVGRLAVQIYPRAEYKDLFALALRGDEEVWSGAAEGTQAHRFQPTLETSQGAILVVGLDELLATLMAS